MNSKANQLGKGVSRTEPQSTALAGEPVKVIADCAPDHDAQLGQTRIAERKAARFLYVVLAVVFVLSLGLIHTARFGEAYDDAIYVTAAKSLATGAGYSLINLPNPVPQTLVPPLYPVVLSFIWKVSPFPENLKWMMLLSAILFVGFLGLAARYLVTQNYATPWQAVVVVILAGVNWRMMTLSTLIVSEVLFALLSTATLYLAELYERDERSWIGAVLGLFAGLAFLTRTSAIVLLMTVASYLVLRHRWKKALLPVAVGSLFVIAWLGWGYINRNPGSGEHASYYAGYARGIDATLGQLQALNNVSRLSAHLQIIETNAIGTLVWMPLQSLGLRSSISPAALITLLLFFLLMFAAGLLRELRNKFRLLHLFLIFYFVLHLIPPSHSYERYLMPIVPLLLLFVVREFSVLFSTMRAALYSSASYFKKAVPAIVVLVFAATAMAAVFSNGTGIFLSMTSSKIESVSTQDALVFDWIKANTNPSDVLVCFADQKFYLYTGRKAVRSITVNVLDLVVYQNREPDADEMVSVFLNIIEESRGSYVIFGASDFESQAPAYGKAIQSHIEQQPQIFSAEFSSSSGDVIIYRVYRDRLALR